MLPPMFKASNHARLVRLAGASWKPLVVGRGARHPWTLRGRWMTNSAVHSAASNDSGDDDCADGNADGGVDPASPSSSSRIGRTWISRISSFLYSFRWILLVSISC